MQVYYLPDFGEVGFERYALRNDVEQLFDFLCGSDVQFGINRNVVFDGKGDHVAQTYVIARVVEERIISTLQIFLEQYQRTFRPRQFYLVFQYLR